MCLSTCTLFTLVEILNFLPFVLLLTMPLYGAVLGLPYALKVSLILYGYAGIQSYLPDLFTPLAGGATLMAFAALPTKLLPEFVVWFYELLLDFTNPLFILAETKQLVLIVRIGTRWMVELIEDNPIWGKTLILLLSTSSYAICLYVLPKIFQAQIEHLSWLIAIVMTLQGVLLCFTIYKPTGVASDAALSCLLSTLSLWIIIYEGQLGCNSFSFTSPPKSVVSGRSFFELLLHLPQISLELAHVPVAILKTVFSFPFWSLLAIRMLTVVLSLREESQDEISFDDDDDDFDGNYLKMAFSISKWRKILGSSTLMKMMSIFAYTQLVSRQLSFLYPQFTSFSSPATWCGGVKWDRIIQSMSFGLYSLWILYNEDDGDIDW